MKTQSLTSLLMMPAAGGSEMLRQSEREREQECERRGKEKERERGVCVFVWERGREKREKAVLPHSASISINQPGIHSRS